MYTITSSARLAENVYELWIEAPHVSRNAEAGQFLVLRINETGERIPLTISGVADDRVRVIFMTVGTTTEKLAQLKAGDTILDVVGPLGKPTEIKAYGRCVLVGGGVGIACLPIIAQALKNAGNTVTGIIGARTRDLLILEDELRGICDDLIVTTDDGSYGIKGFAAGPLQEICETRPPDAVWVIGPAIMMKVTSGVTKPFGIPTFVSLNPVMVDGTGMCGSCRVVVHGETKFACVDGPEFDAHAVDFDLLMSRQRFYLAEEKESREHYHAGGCGCGGEQ
ncbi:MAG: sulfide/dihydroorotate dehydrogenase-like FAD/NAD-binding protein [Methanocalculus sp. MSAO_Arc1]|uniref:sulfide/dihydroorotate dehydrogenase-like FAD/NAD-binding protein n=1 Tax=Methanocalculus TaxID=71151 RepID=UPI000FED9D93|nr:MULTISPECIES: sulfide/dihydroorotate dehydrogenase-like FAD/NAD-binding protein [unclassified Methanocalculus]MCP1661957.1 ferredoxin--NADP+ reductase [Methanocalculus sp. AMF5]RQD80530.1 MAG: sulfide/dihydroorotate dehydrogenase-like FAD/NAD-binding protein [Methanocalculus sp. MSAO_Arc1]